MFKKRSRPASVRDKAAEAAEPEAVEAGVAGSTAVEAGEGDEGDAEGSTQTIEDLIMLRKLRKARQGIDLEKLNRGDERKKRAKTDAEGEDGDASKKYGLQATRGGRDDNTETKRLVRTDNFTQQTNALDVDKHMMAYIEEEMAKRRGEIAASGGKEEAYDPQAELYKLAEKYKANVVNKRNEEEGSVQTSLGMLSAIPEVDLGMENRLKNIEETEKAKREMFEQRKVQQEAGGREEDINYANMRFFKPHQRQIDIATQMEQAKREAAGLPVHQHHQGGHDRPPRPEMATDEAVFERFKKRNRR